MKMVLDYQLLLRLSAVNQKVNWPKNSTAFFFSCHSELLTLKIRENLVKELIYENPVIGNTTEVHRYTVQKQRKQTKKTSFFLLPML